MIIYVHSENRTFYYTSDIIPRKNEILYFPHFGSFKVKNIIYRISDDNNKKDENKLMSIDIYVNTEGF